MRIDDFTLENWLNPACDSEKNKYYLGGSCVLPMTVEELFDLTGESMENFFEELKHMNLGYPRFEGTPRTRKALSKLYKNVEPDEVILCHGGTGANATVCYALIESSDNVISIMPNYQQFFSIPRSIGAELREVDLKIKDGYKLDLSEVRAATDKNTKAILFTNPNNPTGSVMTLDEMNELVEIAKSVDAWIICDEMYRGLDEEYMPSFADLYDKAIVTANSSKIYSMAGTRVGWIVCHDAETRKRLFNWRSYDSICGGVFDEWIFAIALEHVDKIFERSRKIVNANKVVIDKWIEKKSVSPPVRRRARYNISCSLRSRRTRRKVLRRSARPEGRACLPRRLLLHPSHLPHHALPRPRAGRGPAPHRRVHRRTRRTGQGHQKLTFHFHTLFPYSKRGPDQLIRPSLVKLSLHHLNHMLCVTLSGLTCNRRIHRQRKARHSQDY